MTATPLLPDWDNETPDDWVSSHSHWHCEVMKRYLPYYLEDHFTELLEGRRVKEIEDPRWIEWLVYLETPLSGPPFGGWCGIIPISYMTGWNTSAIRMIARLRSKRGATWYCLEDRYLFGVVEGLDGVSVAIDRLLCPREKRDELTLVWESELYAAGIIS